MQRWVWLICLMLATSPAYAQYTFEITDLGTAVATAVQEVEVASIAADSNEAVGARRVGIARRPHILSGALAGAIPEPAGGGLRGLTSFLANTISGGYWITGPGPVGRGFRWSPTDGLTLLPVLDPATDAFSWAKGIARAGTAEERIIGISSPGTTPYRPMWCENSSTCHPLPTFGGLTAEPWAINHLLDIVGQCRAANGQNRACWWPWASTYTLEDLHPPGSYFFSSAWDINGAQEVVISALSGCGVTGTSFVRRASGAYEELAPLPAHALAVARSLNEAGLAAGHSTPASPCPTSAPVKPVTTTATLWDTSVSPIVPVALQALCTNCTGWHLEQVVKIAGNSLVGYGTLNGVRHAYMLTVPPPTPQAPEEKPKAPAKKRWPWQR